jgi:hypothetical protein
MCLCQSLSFFYFFTEQVSSASLVHVAVFTVVDFNWYGLIFNNSKKEAEMPNYN